MMRSPKYKYIMIHRLNYINIKMLSYIAVVVNIYFDDSIRCRGDRLAFRKFIYTP